MVHSTTVAVSPPSLQGVCQQIFSPHLIRNGFVPLPTRDQAEAYDLGELEQPLNFDRQEISDNEDKYIPGSHKTTLSILPTAPMLFDISMKKSPQTSPSAVSDHTASCRSTPSALNSPATAHQVWDSPVTEGHQAPKYYNLDREIKGLDSVDMYHGAIVASMKSEHEPSKMNDSKTLRRLAQNREAARKSRLRKKAYVQQLESSRVKLNQLEQEVQRVRQQGFVNGSGFLGDLPAGANALNGNLNPGAAAFNLEYSRWLDEKHRQMGDLRAALQAHLGDNDLQVLVESFVTHYDEVFRLKSVAVKADVFHLLSGMWKTPAERCFLWMGGFRPSEILKVVIPHLEPLAEQQVLGIYNLQQSSQQAEEALSQGLESLQQNLAETLALGSLGSPDNNMATYMGQMAVAMGKIGMLESFVRQADHLRQQTLQQMHRLLTIRQVARGLLAMGEYFNRLRALSSLWSARPQE